MKLIVNVILVVVAAANGNCNADEQKKISTMAFSEYLYYCGKKALLDPSKIPPCLEKGCSFTEQCANCFGDSGKCVLKNCMFNCMTPASDKCKSCMAKNCNAALEACTGMSEPPPAPSRQSPKCSA